MIGPAQRAQLRRMIGFRFRRHPSLNLPEAHLSLLEQVLEERVRELLAIPVRQRKTERPERDGR